MREHVVLEVARLFAGIVALCALECFLTRMCENVFLEVVSFFEGIVTLPAFERIHP